MKSKIIALAMLFVSVATWAGVVTVSDPGQAPSGGFIITNQVVICIRVLLTASNVNEQVYVTVNQRTAGSILDADLFASGCITSTKFTGQPVILGPFPVLNGETNCVVISVKINATCPSVAAVPVAFDVTSVSNSMSSASVTGILPVQGTAFVVGDPRGVLASPQLFYKYSGAPLDTNGVRLDLIILKGQGSPSIAYEVEYSSDMKIWNRLSLPDNPDWDGSIFVAVFMHLPPYCYYRLKSSTP